MMMIKQYPILLNKGKHAKLGQRFDRHKLKMIWINTTYTRCLNKQEQQNKTIYPDILQQHL